MTTRNATLVVVPGTGARQIALQVGLTVAQLVCEQNLHGRDIIVNGVGVPAAQWNTTTLDNAVEIFATGSVKGNVQRSATLVVVPGTGARQVQFEDTLTVAELVCRENLHGRDIIVNGVGVPAAQWNTFQLAGAVEIFATGSVKGNATKQATLVVVPGTGARQITINDTMTIAQLVTENNLHGRDIILDGIGVPASEWSTRTVGLVSEIFATGSVKGNGAESFQELTFNYESPLDAFNALVTEAEWEHGHNSYSGTIATVEDFKYVETSRVFTEEEADNHASERLDNMEKYECEAINVVNSQGKRGFLFYGWAAC